MFLTYIWLIPLLPAFGAAMMFFFGRKLRKATVSAVCVGTIVLAFLMACGAVWQYSEWSSTPQNFHQPYEKPLYTWLGSDTGHLTYTTQSGKPAEFRADHCRNADFHRGRSLHRSEGCAGNVCRVAILLGR